MKASTVGKATLALAAIALVPSYAAFTPAVLLSLIGLLVAAAAACFGELLYSALTFVVVTFTVALVSPIFEPWRLSGNVALATTLAVPYAAFSLCYFFGWRRRVRRRRSVV